MERPQIVFATCRSVLDSVGEGPYGQADTEAGDGLLATALTTRGFDVEFVAWNDPALDLSTAAACVIRSTWDYPEHLDDFRRWLDIANAQTLLLNGIELVRWNLHKRYLLDLEAADIPIVPTVVVSKCGALDHARLSDEPGSSHVIVKPAVGVGSFGVMRLPLGGRVQEAVAELAAEGDVLVQPYVPSIESEGEISTVIIDGKVSHAVAKTPAVGDYRVQAHHGGHNARIGTSAELNLLASRVVAALPASPAYGRIDTVKVNGGHHLLELELIEPSLFLGYAPGAAEQLAGVIAARCDERARGCA
jgi:glutathione synthase/RimK-type ligase-like ATP-grasp enzyme